MLFSIKHTVCSCLYVLEQPIDDNSIDVALMRVVQSGAIGPNWLNTGPV